LRHHFGDPLLEQIGRNLELTARGRALTDPVKTILSQVSELNDLGQTARQNAGL
jgi:DNA-binding transcriptional LysR family regulator